eukprot:SAG31_NODE_539_length_14296_cov_14.408819_5_plen_98_part_00
MTIFIYFRYNGIIDIYNENSTNIAQHTELSISSILYFKGPWVGPVKIAQNMNNFRTRSALDACPERRPYLFVVLVAYYICSTKFSRIKCIIGVEYCC